VAKLMHPENNAANFSDIGSGSHEPIQRTILPAVSVVGRVTEAMPGPASAWARAET
jgi:hypothetical protein